jgi:hypothetical protein
LFRFCALFIALFLFFPQTALAFSEAEYNDAGFYYQKSELTTVDTDGIEGFVKHIYDTDNADAYFYVSLTDGSLLGANPDNVLLTFEIANGLGFYSFSLGKNGLLPEYDYLRSYFDIYCDFPVIETKSIGMLEAYVGFSFKDAQDRALDNTVRVSYYNNGVKRAVLLEGSVIEMYAEPTTKAPAQRESATKEKTTKPPKSERITAANGRNSKGKTTTTKIRQQKSTTAAKTAAGAASAATETAKFNPSAASTTAKVGAAADTRQSVTSAASTKTATTATTAFVPSSTSGNNAVGVDIAPGGAELSDNAVTESIVQAERSPAAKAGIALGSVAAAGGLLAVLAALLSGRYKVVKDTDGEE